MNLARSILLTAGILAAFTACSYADNAAEPLQEPAKSLPVPTSDISPEMQNFIKAPLNPDWNKLWKSGEEARAFANIQAAGVMKGIQGMKDRMQVSVEPTTMDGVKVYVITPSTIPPENKDKVLIHVHGGCYVLFPGE